MYTDEVELFEPGEYLDRRGPGYFSILAKPNGRASQHSYQLHHLPQVVRGLNPALDSWISQASFTQPNRRAANLESVGLLFCDLDTYHVPSIAKQHPERQADLLVSYCAVEGIPAPSLILFSGRGLQAKWFLTEALGPASIIDWNAVQLNLVRALEDFGSDRNARDVSRVLRVDRTTNTKSGELALVVYVNSGVEAVPTRYDFEEVRQLFEQRYPQKRHEKASQRPEDRRRATVGTTVELQRLNWYRLYDIRDLWQARGGVPEGYRELTLFWELNFLLKAEPVRHQDIWKEAQTLAAQIDPSPGWYRNSDLGTLYRKAREQANGQTVTFGGRKTSPLYTPKNTTLIDRFQITPDEEKRLRTIITGEEKYRRKVEKRRAAGMRPQPHRDEKPWEAEGIPRRTWYRHNHGK